MLKEIIATVLLSSSLGTTLIPKKVYNANTVHGTYVFRDDFSTYLNEYKLKYPDHDVHEIDFSNQYGDTAFKGLFTYNNIYYIGVVETFRIQIDYLENDIYMNIVIEDNGTSNGVFLDYENINDANTLNKIIALNVNQDNVKYHTLYIDNYINFEYEEYDLFMCFYTQSGNQYNTYYNGWYHAINPITWNTYYPIKCQIIVENVMYPNFEFEQGKWYAWYESVDSNGNNEYQEVEIYNNGWKITDMNLYINGMLPNNIYTLMNNSGTFTYVQPPIEDYTFQEFFFSIIDAPLYYIYSLFNWELFGISVFYAFCGLVTMAVVVIVVKKVV